jgi:sec-independent protein translocase protein TatB
MNCMSFSETIFLFFLALVIFGPKKLPEIARQVGKYLNEFRRASNEFKAQIEQEIAHLEVEETRQTILPPKPVEGTTSRTLQAAPVEESKADTPVPGETPAAEAPATGATAAEHQPSTSGNGATPPPATEAIPSAQSAQEVTSPTSQETHA